MSMRGTLIPLRQLLVGADDFPLTDCVFLPAGPISLDSVILVDPADLYDPDCVPPVAIEMKLRYVMMIEAVQQILGNLDAQLPDSSTEQKLEAFAFYLQNDAFKAWD